MITHLYVNTPCPCGAKHRLPVDPAGRVDPAQVEEAIGERTALVSLMVANNEIGTLHPIRAIGAVCKRRGVLFHTDAVQAVGKVPLDVEEMGIDLLSLSAHKIHGPKGVGALQVRSRDPHVRLLPLLEGGGHERGMRSGTIALSRPSTRPSAVCFGFATSRSTTPVFGARSGASGQLASATGRRLPSVSTSS